MAVEVRYHVIRDGQEVAVYLTKKEADEHDKMLDIAYELSEFIGQASKVTLDEAVMEELTIYLARHRTEVIRILKAQKSRKPPAHKADPTPGGTSGEPRAAEAKAPAAKGKPGGKGKKK